MELQTNVGVIHAVSSSIAAIASDMTGSRWSGLFVPYASKQTTSGGCNVDS